MLTRRTLLGAAVGAVAAACGGKAASHSAPPITPTTTSPSPSASPTAPPPDPASVHANEIGVIPVLMHHRLTAKVDSEYDMTPAYFAAELERLHREGYYPVTTLQVARGDLGHVPAGKSPVVLTFDDSTTGQVHYTSAGQIAPDSAIGMLLDFAKAHDDFPAVASSPTWFASVSR